MLPRRRVVSAGITALVIVTAIVLTAQPAGAATRGTDRPMRCTGTGNFHHGVRNRFFGDTNQGMCTHLGHMTAVGEGSDPPFPETGPGTFDVVITAANGDQLFGTGVITAAHYGDVAPDLTLLQTTYIRFTGGTGRFSAVSGSMTETEVGLLKPECEGPVCDSWDTTFADSGTISY